MSKKKKRPHGHYCKICGEYKANEKFSGKGHAAHICKACSRLSASEKAEAMAMNRLMEFLMRRLTDSERKWLEARTHDKRPQVAEMARDIYRECFPHAERNVMKKQLHINYLSFEIHMEVYDEYGDGEMADRCFTADRQSSILTMTDFHAGSGEQSVTLEGRRMKKLLRYIVHTLEIFMWEEDYCLRPDNGDIASDFWSEDDFDMDDIAEMEETEPQEPEGEPCWRVHVEYNNHAMQDTFCYEDFLPNRVEELHGLLLEYFLSEEEG